MLENNLRVEVKEDSVGLNVTGYEISIETPFSVRNLQDRRSGLIGRDNRRLE